VTRQIFRITKTKFRNHVFDGMGGLHADGRWTKRGRPVVYASGSISLAVLEYTVHYKRRGWLPRSVLGHAEIPERVTIQTVPVTDLPTGWGEPDSSPRLQEIGKRWLDEGRFAVLCVPSAVVPQESNFLLNPVHPAFRDIIIHQTMDFEFDRRLVRTARRTR
jgi:RES domain-containing protein